MQEENGKWKLSASSKPASDDNPTCLKNDDRW